jgi:hypothetical protein
MEKKNLITMLLILIAILGAMLLLNNSNNISKDIQYKNQIDSLSNNILKLNNNLNEKDKIIFSFEDSILKLDKKITKEKEQHIKIITKYKNISKEINNYTPEQIDSITYNKYKWVLDNTTDTSKLNVYFPILKQINLDLSSFDSLKESYVIEKNISNLYQLQLIAKDTIINTFKQKDSIYQEQIELYVLKEQKYLDLNKSIYKKYSKQKIINIGLLLLLAGIIIIK